MAEVNEVFDSVTQEQSFFIPGKKAKKSFTPFAKGEYFGHIVECESKTVDVNGGKHRARLYTFTFEASEENKDVTFQFVNIAGKLEDTKGDCYVGKKFKGKVWRFLEPTANDDFESYSEGNANYVKFCEVIGLECPVEKRVIDGNEIEVQLLPNLSTEDMLGKPGKAFVDKGRPWTDKEGNQRRFFDVKWVNKWEDGKEKTISGASDEIPF